MNNTNNYDRRDFDTRSRKSQALSGVTVNFIPRFIPNPAEHFAVGIGIWSSIDFCNFYVDTNIVQYYEYCAELLLSGVKIQYTFMSELDLNVDTYWDVHITMHHATPMDIANNDDSDEENEADNESDSEEEDEDDDDEDLSDCSA